MRTMILTASLLAATLLSPAAFGEAPVGMAAFAGVALFQIWTALHLPQISLPVFKGPNGMPIGAMLLARRHDGHCPS